MLLLQVEIRRELITRKVESKEEASAVYCSLRDSSCCGSEDISFGEVTNEVDQVVAEISYNGRVWPANTFPDRSMPLGCR